MLQDGEEGLGFYRIGSSPINVTAHHCYATLPAASAQMLRIGDVTKIEDMDAARPEDVLYDLMGRKVTNADAKGIYLRNGQKVFMQ